MKSQKGQSLVETALIIPILLMLLFGIVDFGRILHVYLILDHAGREAARSVSIDENIVNAKAEVYSKFMTSKLIKDNSDSRLEILIEVKDDPIRVGIKDANVKLTYKIDFLTPIISQIINKLTLENITVMRVEN